MTLVYLCHFLRGLGLLARMALVGSGEREKERELYLSVIIYGNFYSIGKSTLIKVLLGEVVPQEGIVWKHPNLRVGYVAQHAFHHLNEHLDLTPNQYIQWRFANGDDREVHEKASRLISEEEKKQMETFIDHQGERKQIEVCVLSL